MKTAKEIADVLWTKAFTREGTEDFVREFQRDAWEQGVEDEQNNHRNEPLVFPGDRT